MNLQMIDLSVLVNRASRRALLQAGKVVIVAAASSVEEDSANFLFVIAFQQHFSLFETDLFAVKIKLLIA